jgi:hypothetical protein
VLAALPPGERQIPDDLLRLMSSQGPGASMVLLCRESLVRPTVTLRHGRVTLVEPPFTARRIASRLRVALADEGASAAAPGALGCLEHQRPAYWLGALGAGAEPPPLWIDQRHGLTVLVPAGHTPPWDGPARAAELVSRGGDLEALGRALGDLLGDSGVIHLGPRGDEWVIYWPAADHPLWLCSPQRLPPVWDLGETAWDGADRCLRIAAASGDLIVSAPPGVPGWTGAARPGAAGVLPPGLAEAVADGGPALLEELEQRLGGFPADALAVVVEAR